MKKTNAVIILALLVMSIFTVSCSPEELRKIGAKEQTQLKKFSSMDELKEFLKNSGNSYGGGRNYATGVALETAANDGAMLKSVSQDSVSESAESSDYSETNVQVKGVDEADIVKNDGKYIYTLTQNKVVIVKAYPPEDAQVLSEIEIDGNPREFFINQDKLVVFGTDYKRSKRTPEPVLLSDEEDEKTLDSEEETKAIERILPFPDYSYSYTYMKIYDISDREEPSEEEELIIRGYYYNSRMIGDIVYLISNEYTHFRNDLVPPCVYSVKGGDVSEKCMSASDIYYFDYPDSYEFSTIMALNLEDNSHNEKTVLKGTSQNLYVSEENIFITFQKRVPYYEQQWRIYREVVMPELPLELKEKIDKIEGYDISDQSKFNEIDNIIEEWLFEMTPEERDEFEEKVEDKAQEAEKRIQKELEKTNIQKIEIDGMNIEPTKTGTISGRPLNQFSMDEHDGYFRIAATTSQWNRDSSANHVYVLDEDLEVVGKLEDLAPGERIYSARFMGDRLYLVTFRNIDPLFVIDLETPESPKVLGKLKIPGYSDYLHPYDENHIIGIGKETISDEKKDIAWQQGVKIALFDVSDVEKPKEISKYEIGDRGTDSIALHDHKAFLFSKDKSLLVLPVREAEIDEDKYPDGIEDWQYGDTVFQGAYVFNIDSEEGLSLKGKITHVDDPEKYDKSGHYWYSGGEDIKRSLYMDNVLYTISEKKILANDLEDLSKISEVKLPYEEPEPFYPYRGIAVEIDEVAEIE